MRAAKSGAIVNISSIGGKIYEPFGSWYHASKFAVEGMSDCLRLELEPFGIRVIVIEPGAIKSEWTGIARDNLLGGPAPVPTSPMPRRMPACLRVPIRLQSARRRRRWRGSFPVR